MSGTFPAVNSDGDEIVIEGKSWDGQTQILTGDDDTEYELDAFAHDGGSWEAPILGLSEVA